MKTELMEEFEEETGKHAIWHGKVTKQFNRWKEKHEGDEDEGVWW